MNPFQHIIATLPIAAAILYAAGVWQAAVFYLSAVLIDVDHYAAYIYMKRSLSLREAYRFFASRRDKYRKKGARRRFILMLFHTYESMAVLGILSFLYRPLLFVWLGFLVHIILDIAYNPVDREHRMQFAKNLSITYRLANSRPLLGDIEIG